MLKPLINLVDVALKEQTHGERFAARIGQIGSVIGASRLGCRLVVVPPGKRAWPLHAHQANEEMFVILSGTGSLRYGDAMFTVRSDDVIVCPSGGRETAHQLINTGSVDLRYLAISTMHDPDVIEYPDSGKFAVYAGAAPGGDQGARRFSFVGRVGGAADYWDGEDTEPDAESRW